MTVWRSGGRLALLRFAAWGLPAVAFVLTYNRIGVGSPAGVLYGETIPWEFPPPGLAGQLISPSRGLFIFSPYLILGLVGIWRAWSRNDPGRSPLIRDASVAGGAAWLVFASVGWWWSGWSYGNRYLLDILPIVSLAVAYAVETGVLATRPRRVLVGAALAWSVLLQFSGALYGYGYWHGYNWNATPSIDDTPARLWDWGDSQWWFVLRELGTDPGLVVIPAVIGLLGGALILWPLVSHGRPEGRRPGGRAQPLAIPRRGR